MTEKFTLKLMGCTVGSENVTEPKRIIMVLDDSIFGIMFFDEEAAQKFLNATVEITPAEPARRLINMTVEVNYARLIKLESEVTILKAAYTALHGYTVAIENTLKNHIEGAAVRDEARLEFADERPL